MQHYQYWALARYHHAEMKTRDLAAQMRDDERGELGSWLILAAGLALAAGAAVATLGPWFDGKVSDITGN